MPRPQKAVEFAIQRPGFLLDLAITEITPLYAQLWHGPQIRSFTTTAMWNFSHKARPEFGSDFENATVPISPDMTRRIRTKRTHLKIRAADAKEVGIGNRVEETFSRPNQNPH
jgi:hypothetical protein